MRLVDEVENSLPDTLAALLRSFDRRAETSASHGIDHPINRDPIRIE